MKSSSEGRLEILLYFLVALRLRLRADLHPTEPKTGSSGTPGLRRKEESSKSILRLDFAALG